MANETFVFDAKGIAAIKEVVRQVLGESRGSPVQPQYRGRVNFSAFIGKVKTGGITGRVNATPGAGTVLMQVFNATSGELENVPDANGAPVEQDVKSLAKAPICENRYVLCDADRFGTIWVQEVPQRIWRFTLNENMGNTTSGLANADLLELGGTDTGDDIDVQDTCSIFTDLVDTNCGLCVEDCDEYWAIQAECP